MLPLGAAFVWVLIRHHLPFRSASATATAGIVTLVPEGLVLLTSLTFAVAAVRLSTRGMLVQAFNAVESLANVDTVCMDKTGTLTDGTLALHGVTPAGTTEAATAEDRVRDFAASTTSRNDTVDAIAAALPGTARPARSEVPFSSRWKWSACRLEGDDFTLVLGAPDVLLGAAAATLVSEHEHAGRRALVLGRTAAELTAPGGEGEPPPPIEPIAVIALEEHVRPEAAATIAYLRDQGVAVKVMSGDSPATVAAVAERAGVQVEGPAVDGAHLPEPGPELTLAAGSSTVFARLSPQHKRMLVEALSGSGRYVAMIGDGVNDVPAMKGSRLAIALGSGAQMAKSVADSVLVTDSFAAVPAAIREGRQIILNIHRVAPPVRHEDRVRGLRDPGLRADHRRVPAPAAPPDAGRHGHRRHPGLRDRADPLDRAPRPDLVPAPGGPVFDPGGHGDGGRGAGRLPARAGGAGAVDHRRAHRGRDGVRRPGPVPAARPRPRADVGEPVVRDRDRVARGRAGRPPTWGR